MAEQELTNYFPHVKPRSPPLSLYNFLPEPPKVHPLADVPTLQQQQCLLPGLPSPPDQAPLLISEQKTPPASFLLTRRRL